MTKRLIFGLIFIIVNQINAQVGIGKKDLTNDSVLLEFSNENKGILLPSVANAPNAVGGTFIFNTTTKSMQVFQDTKWTNLTDENQGINHTYSNTGNDVGEGVIIGDKTSSKPGVLVLESTTKAMVLPKVANPQLNMAGSVAGTIVFDTVSNMIAVYDGANWSFWK